MPWRRCWARRNAGESWAFKQMEKTQTKKTRRQSIDAPVLISRKKRRRLLRSRHHLHGPDRARTHIHTCAIHSVRVVRFGRAEPVSLLVVYHVVHAFRSVEALFSQSVLKHGRR